MADAPKYIEYRGVSFCRDDKTGYYLNSTIRKRLHRYVWECEVGEIPAGFQVHHIDEDKANNNIHNLALMTASAHQKLHGQDEKRKSLHRQLVAKARIYAIAWHKSDAGRKWHSEQSKGRIIPRSEKACPICGQLFAGTKQQKFCGNNCKAKDLRRRRKNAGVKQ